MNVPIVHQPRPTRPLRAATVGAAIAAGLAVGPLAGSVAAAPAQTQSVSSCVEYAPVYIAANPNNAQPGESITITGILFPGELVTVALVSGSTTTPLGTATADTNGRFTLTATVPAGTPIGVATLQATSPSCSSPVSGDITIGDGTTTTIPNPASCENGGFSVVFAPTKLIRFDGYNPTVQYTPIVPVTMAAGEWNITEAVSWDSYPDRVNATQTSEIWELEFLSGNSVVARSAHTQDLPDRVATAEWRGPLGTVVLPSSVDGVRAKHRPDIFPDVPWGEANSVFAVSATICTDIAPSTTEGSTTTGPTTTEAGVDGSTTAAPTTAAPGGTTPGGGTAGGAVEGDSASADVLGTSVNRLDSNVAGSTATRAGAANASNLAWTGGTTATLTRIGAALVAVGALFAIRFRRNERTA